MVTVVDSESLPKEDSHVSGSQMVCFADNHSTVPPDIEENHIKENPWQLGLNLQEGEAMSQSILNRTKHTISYVNHNGNVRTEDATEKQIIYNPQKKMLPKVEAMMSKKDYKNVPIMTDKQYINFLLKYRRPGYERRQRIDRAYTKPGHFPQAPKRKPPKRMIKGECIVEVRTRQRDAFLLLSALRIAIVGETARNPFRIVDKPGSLIAALKVTDPWMESVICACHPVEPPGPFESLDWVERLFSGNYGPALTRWEVEHLEDDFLEIPVCDIMYSNGGQFGWEVGGFQLEFQCIFYPNPDKVDRFSPQELIFPLCQEMDFDPRATSRQFKKKTTRAQKRGLCPSVSPKKKRTESTLLPYVTGASRENSMEDSPEGKITVRPRPEKQHSPGFATAQWKRRKITERNDKKDRNLEDEYTERTGPAWLPTIDELWSLNQAEKYAWPIDTVPGDATEAQYDRSLNPYGLPPPEDDFLMEYDKLKPPTPPPSPPSVSTVESFREEIEEEQLSEEVPEVSLVDVSLPPSSRPPITSEEEIVAEEMEEEVIEEERPVSKAPSSDIDVVDIYDLLKGEEDESINVVSVYSATEEDVVVATPEETIPSESEYSLRHVMSRITEGILDRGETLSIRSEEQSDARRERLATEAEERLREELAAQESVRIDTARAIDEVCDGISAPSINTSLDVVSDHYESKSDIELPESVAPIEKSESQELIDSMAVMDSERIMEAALDVLSAGALTSREMSSKSRIEFSLIDAHSPRELKDVRFDLSKSEERELSEMLEMLTSVKEPPIRELKDVLERDLETDLFLEIELTNRSRPGFDSEASATVNLSPMGDESFSIPPSPAFFQEGLSYTDQNVSVSMYSDDPAHRSLISLIYPLDGLTPAETFPPTPDHQMSTSDARVSVNASSHTGIDSALLPCMELLLPRSDEPSRELLSPTDEIFTPTDEIAVDLLPATEEPSREILTPTEGQEPTDELLTPTDEIAMNLIPGTKEPSRELLSPTDDVAMDLLPRSDEPSRELLSPTEDVPPSIKKEKKEIPKPREKDYGKPHDECISISDGSEIPSALPSVRSFGSDIPSKIPMARTLESRKQEVDTEEYSISLIAPGVSLTEAELTLEVSPTEPSAEFSPLEPDLETEYSRILSPKSEREQTIEKSPTEPSTDKKNDGALEINLSTDNFPRMLSIKSEGSITIEASPSGMDLSSDKLEDASLAINLSTDNFPRMLSIKTEGSLTLEASATSPSFEKLRDMVQTSPELSVDELPSLLSMKTEADLTIEVSGTGEASGGDVVEVPDLIFQELSVDRIPSILSPKSEAEITIEASGTVPSGDAEGELPEVSFQELSMEGCPSMMSMKSEAELTIEASGTVEQSGDQGVKVESEQSEMIGACVSFQELSVHDMTFNSLKSEADLTIEASGTADGSGAVQQIDGEPSFTFDDLDASVNEFSIDEFPSILSPKSEGDITLEASATVQASDEHSAEPLLERCPPDEMSMPEVSSEDLSHMLSMKTEADITIEASPTVQASDDHSAEQLIEPSLTLGASVPEGFSEEFPSILSPKSEGEMTIEVSATVQASDEHSAEPFLEPSPTIEASVPEFSIPEGSSEDLSHMLSMKTEADITIEASPTVQAADDNSAERLIEPSPPVDASIPEGSSEDLSHMLSMKTEADITIEASPTVQASDDNSAEQLIEPSPPADASMPEGSSEDLSHMLSMKTEADMTIEVSATVQASDDNSAEQLIEPSPPVDASIPDINIEASPTVQASDEHSAEPFLEPSPTIEASVPEFSIPEGSSEDLSHMLSMKTEADITIEASPTVQASDDNSAEQLIEPSPPVDASMPEGFSEEFPSILSPKSEADMTIEASGTNNESGEGADIAEVSKSDEA